MQQSKQQKKFSYIFFPKKINTEGNLETTKGPCSAKAVKAFVSKSDTTQVSQVPFLSLEAPNPDK